MTSRRPRRPFSIALVLGATALLSGARASAQSARDVDSTAVAPGVRVAAGMRGASRAVVDSSDVRRAAALTFSELLQARAASVNVMMSGGRQIDGGQFLIRGPSTLGTDGAPLLIVDGIRMDEREDDAVGTTSRLDDVAIDDIATVEVLRGPSAAALYGAGASSGVLVVTTKRGPVGRWSAHLRASSEALRDGMTYAERYRRRAVGASFTTSCSLELEAVGYCVPGQVERWRPLSDAGLLRTGVGGLASFDLAGGTTHRDARLSLTLRRGSGISSGDALSRLSTRLNATQRFGSWLEVTGHVSYVGDRTEDSKFGEVIDGQSTQSVGATPVDSFARWATARLGTAMGGRLDHLTTGFDLAVRPMRRLALRAALSRDRVDEGAGYNTGPGTPSLASPLTFPDALGDPWDGGAFEQASSWSTNRETRVTGEYTVPLSVERGAELLLVAGSEREHRDRYDERGSGFGGSYGLSGHYRGLVNDAQFALARMQVLDRFAASVGVRRERDGGVAGNGYHGYPVAEVAVRPATRLLHGDLRLRAAYGESTQRLATFGAFLEFPPYPPYGYYGYPYGYYGGPQPPEPIGPETMQEAEGGFDLGWGARGAISLTAYHRAIRNAIPNSQAIYAPVSRAVSLSSSGVEADARATVVERGSMRWSLRAIVATNRNRVTTPGLAGYPVEAGLMSDQPVGVTKRRPYTFTDANGDGIAEGNEIKMGEATLDRVGGSTPTLSVALHSELALGRRLTLGVIVDRRSGAWTQSGVASSSCDGPENSCRELQDPTTSLDAQAATLANMFTVPSGNPFDASFTRLREVSVRWALPVGRFATFGASGARVMLAGRDLATWTKWPGTDPEVSSLLRSSLTRDDLSAVPLPRRLMVGLEFDY